MRPTSPTTCARVPGGDAEAPISVIDRALDWHHLQKPAQPVVGVFHVGLIYETTRHLIEINMPFIISNVRHR